MKTFNRTALFFLATVLPACGQQLVEFPQLDGAGPDTARTDIASRDGATVEVAKSDATAVDVFGTQVPGPDAATIDGGTDTASQDSVNADAPMVDGSVSDAANRDDGTVDVANVDAGLRDVGNRDTVAIDSNIDSSVDAALGDVRVLDASALDVPTGGPGLDALSLDSAHPDIGGIEARRLDAGNVDSEGIDGSGGGPIVVINLGLAAPFAIAATAGVTNTITAPITQIHGDVVLTPNKTCNAVTVDNAGGFGLCGGMPPTINGTVITNVYPDTTTATAIQADLNAAFLSITPLAGPPAVGSLGGGTAIAAPTTLGDATGSALVLGDNLFTPGVYTSTTSILITGDVTLDGQGDPNAIFIFQSASTLTTADGAASPGAHARILLTNGTKASNVWWQVATSATIGLYSEFRGNILAAFDITMKTGSTACGRSMAGAWVGGNGAFVFDSNVVSVPGNGCPL